MILLKVLDRYIFKEFFKIICSVTFIFFCLGVVLNLFEEVNFFKDFDVGIYLPLLMSLYKVPHLVYNLIPFIMLISSVWLFLKFIRSDELTVIKVSGISNASMVIVPSIFAFFFGIFLIIAINPVTALLSQKYFSMKGEYTQNNDYLAAITVNGIWIKEKNESGVNIVKAESMDGPLLKKVSIYQSDTENNPIRRFEAETADITEKNWKLQNVQIFPIDENIKKNIYKEFIYSSVYNIDEIKNLYSNLDTVAFWNLKNLINSYELRGYSTKEIKSKYQRTIAFPFFLLSMVLLAGVSILGLRFRGNYVGYVFFSIISCVIIYYFNDFSKVLGQTDRLPINLSVWMPILVIFIFSSVGLIHVNQK